MMMQNFWKSVLFFALLINIVIVRIQAHPQNSIEQSLDAVEAEMDEIPNPFYDLNQQNQNLYSTIPLDRLQMLISRYNRPTVYLRSPSVAGMNELYRLPESKRQVRYRQCYFNPISCFKK